MAKATTSLLTILFVAACSIRTGSAFSVRTISRGQNIPRSLCSLSLASNENGGDGDLFLESNNDGPILSQLSTTSRRRLFLQFAGAISAVAPALAPAHADPSFVSNVQGPLQDSIAPGHWIGQFVEINSKTERWEFPFDPAEDVSSALVAVFDDLTPERREKLFLPNYKVKRADASGVHVLTWTKNEWLDSFDVSFQPAGAKGEGSIATASFYATGFLPTSIPLAPVLNVAMAWFPFASPGPRGEMLQDFRLRAIHGLLIKQLQKYH